jgi:hypothetical protein
MAWKWFALEGVSVDFIEAWFVATKKYGGLDYQRPFIGAVVYDYRHRADRPYILTEYNSQTRQFRRITKDRFEDRSYGDGSPARPYGVTIHPKGKKRAIGFLSKHYGQVRWMPTQITIGRKPTRKKA